MKKAIKVDKKDSNHPICSATACTIFKMKIHLRGYSLLAALWLHVCVHVFVNHPRSECHCLHYVCVCVCVCVCTCRDVWKYCAGLQWWSLVPGWSMTRLPIPETKTHSVTRLFFIGSNFLTSVPDTRLVWPQPQKRPLFHWKYWSHIVSVWVTSYTYCTCTARGKCVLSWPLMFYVTYIVYSKTCSMVSSEPLQVWFPFASQ